MDLPKIELKDDINSRDIMLFVGLLLFLGFWVWLVFWSDLLYH